MPMFLSLLYIPGFSFGGCSASRLGARPQSITNSGQVSAGSFTLSKPTENICSFGAAPLPVYRMQQPLQMGSLRSAPMLSCSMMPQTARSSSASWTGESCSGDVIQ